MKYFILMLVAVAAVSAVPDQVVNLAAENPQLMANLFTVFGAEYHRHYATPQEARLRLKQFRNFVKFAAALNAEYPEVEYGVTRFADMTDAEREAMTGFNATILAGMQTEGGPVEAPVGEGKPILGYANHQARYGPVKDQGTTSACWAFAATAVIEGYQSILTGRYTSLSEQMTADCTYGYSSIADGGYTEKALKAIKELGKLATAADWPFKSKDGSCKKAQKETKNALRIKISRVDQIKKDSVAVSVLEYVGPIVVNLGFDRVLSAYKSGIHTDRGCITCSGSHAVAMVGYTRDYWLSRNSFGAKWGERGYFRMTRKVPNMCRLVLYSWWITAHLAREIEE